MNPTGTEVVASLYEKIFSLRGESSQQANQALQQRSLVQERGRAGKALTN